MSLVGRKKAPAGALSPSTVLLRGILSVYKTKQLYCVSKKYECLLLGEKKAPAGALSPSTVLLRGILSVSKTKQLYCLLKNKNVSFKEKKSPCGSAQP